MEQFVKARPKTGSCFTYLCKKFPHLSEAKLKEGIFVGPDVRRLMSDDDFLLTMSEVEREVWTAFQSVVRNFLGNNKDPDYVTIVANMLKFKVLGCSMSLKLHFLHAHLDLFPGNLGAVSEEQGEPFHQDVKEMEQRYHGRWNVNMMGDYCWTVHREITEMSRKRNSNIRTIDSKRKRRYQGKTRKLTCHYAN
jgi:hypothetical protein